MTLWFFRLFDVKMDNESLMIKGLYINHRISSFKYLSTNARSLLYYSLIPRDICAKSEAKRFKILKTSSDKIWLCWISCRSITRTNNTTSFGYEIQFENLLYTISSSFTSYTHSMVHAIIECHANNAFADHNTFLVHVKSNDTKEMKINFLFHI